MLCEGIIYGDDSFPNFSDWSAEDKRNAMAHLKGLKSFDFVCSLTALQRTLLYLREPALKLHGKSQDIMSGVSLVQEALSELKTLCSSGMEDYSK